MASDFRSCLLRQTLPYHVFASFLFLLASLPINTNSLSFNFPSFNSNNPGVILEGDASVSGSEIQLTKNHMGNPTRESYGRALYPKAVQLWDANTKKMTDFTTEFTFSTAQANSTSYGDGLTFLLVPEGTPIPKGSFGGCFGLFPVNENKNGCILNQTVVAVEFDTFQNTWDPSSDHIGIDVNSITSKTYADVTLKNTTPRVFISYDSTTKNLSVILSTFHSPYTFSLSYIIDLSIVLPERVQVGFSAGTGDSVEFHSILAWSFNSTLEDTVPPPSPTPKL